MSIGFGIFLLAAGAILAFGVRDRSGALDLSVVGVIIMLAGACGIWLSYSITNQRRRVESQSIDPAVEEEYRALHERTPSEREAAAEHAVPGEVAGREEPARPEDGSAERHVDLDPAANGLSVEIPDRRLPVRPRTEAATAPAASLRSRLMSRLRARR